MREFFKDYLFCFFSHKHAKNIFKRSFLISFINVIVSLVAIVLGLFYSKNISFEYKLNQSDSINPILEEVFSSSLVVDDGYISLPFIYNSYKEDPKDFKSLNYEVIIDTRAKETNYAEFTFNYVKDDSVISYEDYLLLDENDKKSYSISISYTGNAVDTVSLLPTMGAYFTQIGDTERTTQLQNFYQSNQITEFEYANLLYVEYGKSIYPEDIYNDDLYGDMPTMYSFYESLLSSDLSSKDYFFIYDNGMEISFSSNSGHTTFYGTFKDSKTYTFDSVSDIKVMLVEAYFDSSIVTLISFVLVGFFLWFLLQIAYVVVAFLIRFVFRLVNPYGHYYFLKIINLNNSFVLVGSIISVVLCLALSFFVEHTLLFAVLPGSILAISVIRTIIYYIIEKKPSQDFVADQD